MPSLVPTHGDDVAQTAWTKALAVILRAIGRNLRGWLLTITWQLRAMDAHRSARRTVAVEDPYAFGCPGRRSPDRPAPRSSGQRWPGCPSGGNGSGRARRLRPRPPRDRPRARHHPAMSRRLVSDALATPGASPSPRSPDDLPLCLHPHDHGTRVPESDVSYAERTRPSGASSWRPRGSSRPSGCTPQARMRSRPTSPGSRRP